MKFLAIALLALSLTACKGTSKEYAFNLTLKCELSREDGTVSQREFRFTQAIGAYREPQLAWTYREGAWAVADLWSDRVYKTVTPFVGESCTPT